MFFTWNAQGGRYAQSDSEKYRVEFCLELGQFEIYSQLFRFFNFYAEFGQHPDFLEGHLNGLTKANDAVSRKAAGHSAFFKHRHAVTAFGELTCTREAGGASANDGDLLPGAFNGLEKHQIPPISKVHGISLQSTYGDRLVSGSEHARAFT